MNVVQNSFEIAILNCHFVPGMHVYIENNTWVRENTRFISSVGHDIPQVSAANE
jgi:hypothetical protein